LSTYCSNTARINAVSAKQHPLLDRDNASDLSLAVPPTTR